MPRQLDYLQSPCHGNGLVLRAVVKYTVPVTMAACVASAKAWRFVQISDPRPQLLADHLMSHIRFCLAFGFVAEGELYSRSESESGFLKRLLAVLRC